MNDNQAACIAIMKIATVRTISPEKIPAAQRLRCAHIRSVSRIWRKSVARSAGACSTSQVGGEVRGMNKMNIERNQKGGKTARKQMTNGPDIRATGGRRRHLPKPYINKNFARRNGLSSSQGPKCSEYGGRRASSSSEARFADEGYS